MGDPITRLLELDVRHGELLDRLVELDQQINHVLDDWTKSKELFSEKHLESLSIEGCIQDESATDSNVERAAA